MVIDYDGQSLISQREKIKNKKAVFFTTTGNQGGHSSLWHSVRSNKYQDEVDKNIKKMKLKGKKKEEIAEYVSSVDHYLYSEINQELFDSVLQTYKKVWW